MRTDTTEMNSVGPRDTPGIPDKLNYLKSTFKISEPTEENRGFNTAIATAEALFDTISKLVSDGVGTESANLKEELSTFLANRDGEYVIDDCVRLCLLRHIVEYMAPQTDEATRGAAKILGEILIERQPYLCFLPIYPGVIRGDFTSLKTTEADTYFKKQNGNLFSWACVDDKHRTKMSQNLNVSIAILASPFYGALNSGDDGTVDRMIECMETFLERGLSTAHTGHQQNKILGDILGTAHPHYGTPLEYTYKCRRYPGTPATDETETSFTPHHVKIMKSLLARQPDLVTRDTIFGNTDPNRIVLDTTFRRALGDRDSTVVRIILEHAPREFLKEYDVVTQLKNPNRSESMTLAELFLDHWCETKKITPKIGIGIIKHDTMELWKRPSVSSRLEELKSEAGTAQELLEAALEYNRPEFVREVLGLVPGVFDANQARKLVKRGLWDVWELGSVKQALMLLLSLNQELADNLLVLAVQYKQVQFAQDLLRNNQSLATRSSSVPPGYDWEVEEMEAGIYPLWHNNCVLEENGMKWRKREDRGDSERTEISKALVQACIRETENMQKLCEIFQYSHETDKFARSLPKLTNLPRDTHRSHCYESVLRYAAFPALGSDTEANWRGKELMEHEEVFQILGWLRGETKVEEILKLSVLDRIYKPHDEHRIAECVRDFSVRILDWRCLDLAISAFEEGSGNSVQVIHLYSSGKRATISHWLSPDGIQSLPNEAMSRSNMDKIKEVLIQGIEVLKANKPELECTFEEKSWNEQTSQNNSTLSDIAKRAVPKVSPFILKYRNHVYDMISRKEPFRPTRIAVIDNGIMNIDPLTYISESPSQQTPGPTKAKGEMENAANDLNQCQGGFHRVVKGQSFVDENYTMGSWSFSSDPHGSQMMNLICAIDPCCEIYVAKVVEGRHGIVPERLARAIQWAINQEVDIISMSLACYEEDFKVTNAVQEADSRGILVLCSAHDEGLNIEKGWPASMSETITFAASNQFGRVTRNMRTDTYDFCLHATEIFAGNVPFMQFEEYVSGSSVATAIGAGLSSLLISCHYLANGNRPKRGKKWKNDIVKKILQKTMVPNQTSKYVQLDNFCEVSKTFAGGAHVLFDDILKKHFNASDDILMPGSE
ncbi:hypothetical protein EKO27_g8322 [Xylaria grammica]|uniref:Peptidase S8/S53 domain-containing protein n=1 Tax=Xylaria grammica TaxID=363999 RepID=A0A439CXB2_9PEZI|nr:hypothetical protein EKO27_g8322 [Xylaria grammica]